MMNPSLRLFAFILAITGFTVSIIVHVICWFHIDPGFSMAAKMILQLGMFAVLIPVIFHYKQQGFQSPLRKDRLSGFEFYKAVFKGLPVIAIVLLALCMVYTALNFFFVNDFSQSGTPEIQNGMFVLNDHGSISSITEWEYHDLRSQHIRLISGHWIFFYGFGIVGLLPRKTEVL